MDYSGEGLVMGRGDLSDGRGPFSPQKLGHGALMGDNLSQRPDAYDY